MGAAGTGLADRGAAVGEHRGGARPPCGSVGRRRLGHARRRSRTPTRPRQARGADARRWSSTTSPWSRCRASGTSLGPSATRQVIVGVDRGPGGAAADVAGRAGRRHRDPHRPAMTPTGAARRSRCWSRRPARLGGRRAATGSSGPARASCWPSAASTSTDLLATASTGLATVAVVSPGLPGLDADSVDALRRAGLGVVVVADPGDLPGRARRERLRRLGVARRAPSPDADLADWSGAVLGAGTPAGPTDAGAGRRRRAGPAAVRARPGGRGVGPDRCTGSHHGGGRAGRRARPAGAAARSCSTSTPTAAPSPSTSACSTRSPGCWPPPGPPTPASSTPTGSRGCARQVGDRPAGADRAAARRPVAGGPARGVRRPARRGRPAGVVRRPGLGLQPGGRPGRPVRRAARRSATR